MDKEKKEKEIKKEHHEYKEHKCDKHKDCKCKHDHECECHEKHHDKHHDHEKHKHDKHHDHEKPHEHEIKKLKDKVHELEEKNHELEEKSLRDRAELINYRKRKEEETARLMKYSNESLVKEVLPILDNFERAIDMDDDNLEDEVSKFLQGFKMVYCNLVGILNQYEVKEIESLNQPFDPTYHQAVMTEKREGVDPGIVIEVLQKGYMLKDKVIRPTMVKVSE